MGNKTNVLALLALAGALGAMGCSDDPAPSTDAGTGTDVPVTNDLGADAGPGDAGPGDAGPGDTGAVDAGPGDAGPGDAGPGDAGPGDAGPGDAGPGDAGPMRMARTTPTNGSAVAISADNAITVAVNRTAHSVAVFNSSTLSAMTPSVARTALLAVADAEPWAVVLSNDGNTAYVALRRTGELLQVNNLRTAPALGMRVRVGSEPTGIAISPTGATVYVANWSDGTVTEVATATMMVTRTVDLNVSLASTGALGNNITPRPAMAHPRALVVTNDGDGEDGDETVFVTEFFSQARTTGIIPTDDSAFDLNRQGLVYRYNAGSGTVAAPISLSPVTDTGFRDSVGATSATTGQVTGCFPNQLYGATLGPGGRLYIPAVCTSPRGPTGPVMGGGATNNIRTQVHATLFVVDTAMGAEIPAQRVLLSQRFNALYDAAMVDGASADRRMPLIPQDVAFVPGTGIAYVVSYGSDAVFRVQFADNGTVQEVGSTTARFINLAPGGAVPAGRLPVGIAVAPTGSRQALVINENSRNLSVVNFATQAVGTVAESADAPTGAALEVNTGRRFFVTGLGRWSLNGQGWNSCEACHPDGQTDNVTWFFARGPRQTTSLDGTFDGQGNQRILNWTGIFDEVHDFELNTRGNSGGVGAIVHRNNDGATPPRVTNSDRIVFDGTVPVPPQLGTVTPQAGLSGSAANLMPTGTATPRSTLADWNEINAYVRTIRAPRAPSNLESADVTAGRTLFEQNNCAGCHGGSLWTIARRFYTPSEANNNPTTGMLSTVRYTLPTGFPAALNPAAGNDPMRSATLRLTPIAGANDQINCVLRNVGTFPAMLDPMTQAGVAPMGVRVREVRADMATAAQGATGFNPPALVGMNVGAPYFHAGNARTLEEALSETFQAHHRALSSNFLQNSSTRATEIRQLTAFLLSIDDGTTPVAIPGAGAVGFNPVLCPTSL